MTRETIKEYILQVKSQDGTEALYNRWEPDILVEVINEILNDHEAQIKALQSRSCEGCKWDNIPFPSNQFHCDECKYNYDSYNDNFEPKES